MSDGYNQDMALGMYRSLGHGNITFVVYRNDQMLFTRGRCQTKPTIFTRIWWKVFSLKVQTTWSIRFRIVSPMQGNTEQVG